MASSGRSTGTSLSAVLRAISGRGPSGRPQNPAAQSVVTLRHRSDLANSSATQPPSELPATWARSTPSESSVASIEAAMAPAVGGAPSGISADSPKPGMSTAIVS